MEPLDPNDPLWKILGQTRPPEVRPQFVANVVRAARNTPQERSWWMRLRAWWAQIALPMGVPSGRILASAVAAVALVWLGLVALNPMEVESPSIVAESSPNLELGGLANAGEPWRTIREVPLVPEVETQLESLDYLDALLAVEDTSGFTDSEIAYLLY